MFCVLAVDNWILRISGVGEKNVIHKLAELAVRCSVCDLDELKYVKVERDGSGMLIVGNRFSADNLMVTCAP